LVYNGYDRPIDGKDNCCYVKEFCEMKGN
jgi:hypothetical protein